MAFRWCFMVSGRDALPGDPVISERKNNLRKVLALEVNPFYSLHVAAESDQHQTMTAEEYKRLREAIGTPSEVAALLGVSRMTIHNRERGRTITPEAAMAILALAGARKSNKN